MMSTSYSNWFRKGIEPGTIITLDKPVSSRWKILEKLNEHDYQVHKLEHDDYGFRSFASTKILCCDPKRRSKKALMRTYLQVPHRTTEIDNPDTRGRQATKYTPPELIALLDLTQKHSSNTPKLLGYKTGTQDRSGLVPGGFVTWLVWEIVPGLGLGDRNGAGPFWGLESYEREQVREILNQDLPERMVPQCDQGKKSSLAPGNANTLLCRTLQQGGKPKRPVVLDAKRMATWELAKPDPADRWKHDDWDGDTSRWEW